MATTLKKQFLDYAGLQQFWGIIDAKFANKTDAVKVESFGFDTTDASVTMTYKDSTTAGKSYGIAVPMATNEKAGMLSADDKALIDNINNKINEMAPMHGIMIEGKEINLPGKRGNIGLRFNTAGKVEDNTRTAFIELVDLAYPGYADGKNYSWSVITESEYDSSKKHHYAFDGKYYAWSQEGVEGPINNVGEPLMSQPISSIDVSELVKAGLLQDADVVLKDGKMQLELTFITNGAGNETKVVYVDVTDLVDVYTEGEGIEITNSSMSADGAQKEGTIKLRVANYNSGNELGGIRVGYDDTAATAVAKQHYKVQLDATGNAYVAVPWEHTSVNVTSNDANSAGENYLVVKTNHDLNKVDTNGIPTPAYNFTVEVGAGIKNAETLAGSSVQSVKVGTVSETDESVSKDAYIKIATAQKTRTVEVDGETKTINAGTDVTAELTASAKDSLGLADTAVQSVVTTDIERGDDSHTPTSGTDLVVSLVDSDNVNTAYVDGKGKKAIKVTLGSKTTASLDKADTAIQTVSILGKTLSVDVANLTAAEAAQNLELGTAANVNTVEVMPDVEATDANKAQFQSKVTKADGTQEDRFTVATAYAVKKYVDDENSAQSDTLRSWVTDEVIAGLDADITLTAGASEHADYNTAYPGAAPQQVMIGVTQADGVVTTAKPYVLGITDIADFAPLSEADIKAICGIDA